MLSLVQLSPSRVHRFTVDEYHQMIQSGVLGEGDAVELLEGWVVDKMPRTPPHDATIDVAAETVGAALPVAWRVRVQSAITLRESEPEPDLAVVRGPARRYTGGHPGPADIALLIEVAGSSLDHDRDVKGPIYAAAGVEQYWIVNLDDRRLKVYTNPSPVGYAKRVDLPSSTSVALDVEGQIVATLSVRDLLA